MDDDVQYLGTRLATAEPLVNPCDPKAHPSTTGIILHVEKCGERSAHDLTFYRARSSHVNIGRKSGSDDRSMRRENDDHNAVFTCQVVSAKHAKLVLSDSGQVYIVDLHSRHGTHLLRRGETAPKMLQPEVETPLNDGDVLTFGKVVGAGSYHVSPVTVRVELVTSHPSSESAADRALTPFNPPSPVLSRPRKLSSGRYGLNSIPYVESDVSPSSSISVSSDVASSPSEQESDVEDEHSCIPAALRDDVGKSSVKIPAFRSFIRDIYHNAASNSPIILDVVDDPLEDAPPTPPSADIVRPPSPVVVVIEPFSKSRSQSPMEVTTRSPSPPSEAQQSEPAVIGAWPASRPESPRHSSLEVEAGRSDMPPTAGPDREPESILPAHPSTCPSRVSPLSNDALIELMHRLPPPPPFFPIGGPFSTSIASDFGLPSVPPPPPPPLPPHRMPPIQPLHKVVTECVASEIKGSLKNVEDRMTALQGTVSDLLSRQSMSEDDVDDIQSRIDMLEPESERLLCRVAGAERNIASLSLLQGQMTALQNQVTTLRERLDAIEPGPVENPMDDVKTCAAALNNVASEMKSLREDVEQRIEAKMEAIQSARVEALDALKEVVVQAEAVRSSKRKREDEERVEAVPEVVCAAPPPCPIIAEDIYLPEVVVPQVPAPPIIISAPVTAPVATPAAAPDVPAAEPTRPPSKRARTAIYSVARTAAAMAVGAAATWSALAFS